MPNWVCIYSMWGLINALNRQVNMVLSRYVKLLILPKILFAVFSLLDMFASDLSLESLISPRSFSSSVYSKVLLSSLYWNPSSSFFPQSHHLTFSKVKF